MLLTESLKKSTRVDSFSLEQILDQCQYRSQSHEGKRMQQDPVGHLLITVVQRNLKDQICSGSSAVLIHKFLECPKLFHLSFAALV